MEIPLPDKPVNRLTRREMAVFRKWVGLDEGGPVVPYPTAEEARCRQRRERWKRRYAGKGAVEPRLLVRNEQIVMAKANARRNAAARKWIDGILERADAAACTPDGFYQSFIPDVGPWNSSGNFCPNCYPSKSPERISWRWDWRDPDRISCPHCGMAFPNAGYPEDGVLSLPRTGKQYTFHILKAERESADWRLGEAAKRFVGQPIHESFSGNIRTHKIGWALSQVEPLGLAYSLTGREVYARTVERILLRMAEVYPGYLLQSYFQDIIDADPGYAVDHAEELPTVLKRNACLPAYDGRYGYGQDRTTTHLTKVATGLWGCSRIAREQFSTGSTFLSLFLGYDQVKRAIAPAVRRRLEQDFLLELYLDVRAYTPITNKSGAVRAARVAFGRVYNVKTEVDAGLKGFRAILEAQFHPDGSPIETPGYGQATIREGLWMIPEMLPEVDTLPGGDRYRAALDTLGAIATPPGNQPPIDDCHANMWIPRRTVDIASTRYGVSIPDPGDPPSDFAILNTKLGGRAIRRPAAVALNRFYEGRRLACVGYGSGPKRVQMYVLGEDGGRVHRHAGALTVQLHIGDWDVFPDLGYISNHPANQWVKATASHQTVVVDGSNSVPSGPSSLLGFVGTGRCRFVDMASPLGGGAVLRRALTLIKKDDGSPILIDLFEVTGGRVHDYNVRANVPPGQLSLSIPDLRPRRPLDYRSLSSSPLLD
ncbi:MAG: heparinase II/III family protein, partial [Candidatus Latescibacteria bacterium]|nr:heparinase II/III family protein [Candidatus Latescibacterota bacterium]